MAHRRLRMGLAMRSAGCLLVTASLFIPWLDLTTSFFPGADGSEWFSPGFEVFYLLTGRRAALVTFSLVFLFVAVVIVATTAMQIWRPAWVNGGRTSVLVITLALIGLGIEGIVYFFVPFGLSLGYPYYDVTPEIGGLVAAAGLICALASAAHSEPTPFRQLINSATPTSDRGNE